MTLRDQKLGIEVEIAYVFRSSMRFATAVISALRPSVHRCSCRGVKGPEDCR